MIMIANWSLDRLVSLTDTRVEPEMEKGAPGPATPEVQQLMKLRKKKSTSCEATTIQDKVTSEVVFWQTEASSSDGK